MHFLYIFFDLCVFILLSICLVNARARVFIAHPQKMFVSSLIGSIPFIILDFIVTGKWWYFHPEKTIGVFWGNLPLEEYLFYALIPSACLFLHIIARTYVPVSARRTFLACAILALITVSGSALFFLFGKVYFAWMLLFFTLLTLYDIVTKQYILSTSFYATFSFMILGTTILFDNYLTGFHILTYNPAVIIGIHIGSMPIEDIFFGLNLATSALFIYLSDYL